MNNFLVTQKFYENNRKKQSRCSNLIWYMYFEINQIRVLIIFLLGFSASLLYELSLYRWGISTKSLYHKSCNLLSYQQYAKSL